MKALILNCGPNLDDINGHPKCLMELSKGETILSRQLRLLCGAGVRRIAIVSDSFSSEISSYCGSLNLPLELSFFDYRGAYYRHYIYGMFCARKFLVGNMLLLHSNLVFEIEVLNRLLGCKTSCMTVSTTAPAREELNWVFFDGFRAYFKEGQIVRVDNKLSSKSEENKYDCILPAWRFYRLRAEDLQKWMLPINRNCNHLGLTGILAEEVLPPVSPVDIGNLLCTEVDNPEQLEDVIRRLNEAD